MSSAKDDEALARALQEEYRRDYEARKQQQPSPTAPPEEFRPVEALPSTVESDEQLARRLAQEMEDEEMARRLSEEQSAPSRPRPSQSTNMSGRSRGAAYSAGAPVSDEADSSPPTSSRIHSLRPTSSRRSSFKSSEHSSHQSLRKNSQNKSSRGRQSTSSGRRPSDWTRVHHPNTSSRRASDVTGSTDATNPSPSRQSNRNSSRSSHSQSRGRGNAICPEVEPDYALQPTSIDPPTIVKGTVVDMPSPITSSQPIMEQYPAVTTPEPDVELAMRLAQEERDAALAQQLERSDQEIASRNATRLATATGSRRRPWTCRRVMGIVIPMVLIAGAAVVIMLLVAGRGDLSNIPNVFDNDPFKGTNPDDASRWKNNGDGLRLEVVNALQEQWWDHFNIAMDEWDSGTPDALVLSRSTTDYDYDCSPIQGKMKVCNGDYGDTGWKGINQVLLSGGWIISSVAKLNEYYLAGASEAQRQYTTCHEIGKFCAVLSLLFSQE